MNTPSLITALIFIITACSGENPITPQPSNPPHILGMNYSKSKHPVPLTYSVLRNTIETNPNLRIIAEVNHAQNAASVDLSLRPTQLIFFGNPKLGTPLMQKNPLAGLDLPQKILVYQNELEEVFLGYNGVPYLTSRHGLDSVPSLPIIANALQTITSKASENEVKNAQTPTVALAEGIITKTSTKSFDNTYSSLQNAIDINPNLRIIAEVNHTANAESIGETLNPIRLIIFGNPKLGTPLMQNAQTTAIDLPQKMLVWEDDNKVVHVSYNDPAFLVKRHDIKEVQDVIETISGALQNLSTIATK